jgi:hypothetical protein
MARFRFALDQNFPPLLPGVNTLLPEVDIANIRDIDVRMPRLSDRDLVLALYQLGWHGLITNNYKMLWQPVEIAAIVKTKLTVFAVQGLGDDPVRAAGAVLLDLPGALKRIAPGKSHVFLVNPRNPLPKESWEYFREAATRRNVLPDKLYQEVKVTDSELASSVLPPLSQ